MVINYFIAFTFWLLTLSVFGQSLVADVTVNPTDAYIGQPVQLKVSVYTSTWFTSGIDVGNIQVDGALTVYFRSVSSTKTINGKKYAGVDFYYNLFPTDDGIVNIPELNIQVESPKDGDFKGIKSIVKTAPKNLSIKAVPLGYNPNNWLVATSLNINEKWSAPITDVKVGDVVQRTISRSAGGTLSEFIPATIWESTDGISIYPKRAQVKTNKSKTGVSAQRIENVNYLFEKEGEIVLPAIEYVYWNSVNKKFYRNQIDSITIQVKPNADLTMLASIKKTLQKENIEETEQEDKAFLILGISPKVFIKYLVFGLIALFILFKVSKKIISFYWQWYGKYLKSEPYAFMQVRKAVNRSDFNNFIKTSNAWLLKSGFNGISFQDFVRTYGTENLDKVLKQLNEDHFKHQRISDRSSFNILLDELKRSRQYYLSQQRPEKKPVSRDKGWLNPVSAD